MQTTIIPIAPAIHLKKMVVAIDFSYASAGLIPFVSALGRRFKSEVVITHAVAEPALLPESAAFSAGESEAAAKQKIAEILRRPELDEVNVHGRLIKGDAATEILRVAHEETADLLVVGTHGHRGFRHFLIGSVCEEIMRHAHCPVLTIGPRVPSTVQAPVNILIPTDLSDESLRCVDMSNAIANEFKAQLHFLHVLPPETGNNPDTRALAQPLITRMGELVEPHVCPSCAPNYLVEVGPEAETILNAADTLRAGLIVMGVRPGSASASLHSTILYRLVANAKCPVLTLRKEK